MTGTRLTVGLISMGVIVPVVLYLLLPLDRPMQLFIVGATCFFAWGVADVVATILSRPRLQDRTPGKAFREWKQQ